MTSNREFLRSISHEYGLGGGGRNADNDEDEDSDTLTELSFSRSPTSSLGRSSTGSIPWAEDAVKQNQVEWERIERIFYGEEDLPTDVKLREEFLEWMTAFPHLRVQGSAMLITESPTARSSDPFHEETFAIDPPYMSRVRSSKSGKSSKQLKESEFQLVPKDIERYLHISSGQILRNNHRNAKDLVKNNSEPVISTVDSVEKPPKQKSGSNLIFTSAHQPLGIIVNNHLNHLVSNEIADSRNNSAQSVSRFNNSIMHRKLAPLGQRPQPKVSHVDKPLHLSASATNTRIPPLSTSIKFIVRNANIDPGSIPLSSDQRHAKFNLVKSATSSRYPLSPTKNIITLPALSALDPRDRTGTIPRGSRNRTSFSTEIVGRSISAAVTQKQPAPKSGQSGGNSFKVNVIHYHH